jgi:type VI secretion system protein ImpA
VSGALTLADISVDAPSGENMEFDPDFGALDRACQGKPEAQYGDTIIPAVPPEWKEARSLAQSLLERTRDLRILVQLAMARLNLDGVPGYAEVLSQIRHQLEERWDSVHPQLDPEDDNDPTLRANALFRLQDPLHVMRVLRDMPLAASQMTGPVTWRDISAFEGTVEPEQGRERMTEAFIRGAFARTNAAGLAALTAAVGSALADVAAIPAAFDARAGYGTGPDLSNLSKLLGDIQQKLRRFEPRADEPEPEAEPERPAAGPAGGGEEPARAAAKGFASIRSITSVSRRDDALYLLEVASGYFRANEPSSPVPMLIDRARRLATMDFMDVLRDLAPDGLNQAQVIAGPQPE